MVTSCLRSVIREEAQALRLEFFRQTGITAGAGDMSAPPFHHAGHLQRCGGCGALKNHTQHHYPEQRQRRQEPSLVLQQLQQSQARDFLEQVARRHGNSLLTRLDKQLAVKVVGGDNIDSAALPLPESSESSFSLGVDSSIELSPSLDECDVEMLAPREVKPQEYDLPLLERRYLAQTVFCGRAWYISHVVQPPLRITRSLQSLLGSFFWSGGTELVCRAALGQPRNRGGFAFPSVSVRCRLLALRFLLRLLNGDQCPALDLACYFLGTKLRYLLPGARLNSAPQALNVPAFYSTAVAFYRHAQQVCPDVDILENRVVDTTAALLLPLVPPARLARSSRVSWSAITASFLPGHLRDFMWRLGWRVLPTRDRLERWGMVPSSICPNCPLQESNQHVLQQCVIARVFWRAVNTGFRGLGVNRFVTSGRCSRSRFAHLLIAAGAFCLWRNRCEAVAAGHRRRTLFPILERLYSELMSFLSEELFFLGEEEFLRQWSCRFLSVVDG
ncbi:uncharacterized protein LOC125759838, partial [Rhipicephalus sanguineus]|uniref:uncharacterized protein LOC125759838 n=1 Tax=Rhipicephalus sanguineus TaxID=34632 RepID=UPI0020C22BE4